jgi:hypothetical protein
MKRKEIIVDRDKMYALTEDASGQLFLEVVVGGFAMENMVIPLSAEERSAYQTNGKSKLDDLAYEICKEPENFRGRAVI